MILLMEDSFFYKLFILFILAEAGGILCDYRGHPIKNQLITNLVVGKENIVHDIITQCINK